MSEAPAVHEDVETDRLSDLYDKICSISESRFRGYLDYAAGDRSKALLIYLWNIELCTALVPVLNGAEVLLKNTIHSAMSAWHNNDPYWFAAPDYISDYDQQSLLARTLRDVNRKREVLMYAADKPNTDPEDLIKNVRRFDANDIIAESPFRYWTSLLNYKFEPRIWKRCHYSLLLHRDKAAPQLHRNRYAAKWNKIREVRNRVYHNEPIYHRSPETIYASAMELIAWMNPHYAEMTELTSHFEPLWSRGEESFCDTIKERLCNGT